MSSYEQGIIILIGINIIAVLGVSILTGFTRIFSFGNGGFMAIGAYVSALLSLRTHAPFVVAILGGMLVAAVVAWMLGKLTLGLNGDYFLIATLGFGECVRVLFEYLDPITGGARGLPGIPAKATLPVVLVSVVLAILLAWNFLHSRYGRNLMAIREQGMAAEAVGIDTARYKNLAFVVSAIFAGWSGALYAHYLTFIAPNMFNLDKSAELTITVVIGGLGSLTGSVISTVILTVLPEVARAADNYRMLFYGVAVVAIITLRPAGLMGYRELSWAWLGRWRARRPAAGSELKP
jgi:branched-chain amino acid transport system permease protein